MPALMPSLSFRNLRGDLFGGLTAAVVALPLALAFGVASGLGPIAGLYGAIATGFFAALFGGTPSQVSGPTGPMTVVMGAVVASHAHNLPEAFAIVILGGLLQILFGAARLGRYVVYTPYSVVSGFMTGIGVIIIVIQIPPFLGLPASAGGPVGTLRALVEVAPQSIGLQALALSAISLALIVFWPRRLARLIPAPLAALLGGTALSLTVLTGVPLIGEVPRGLPQLAMPAIDIGNLPGILQAGLVLALLGSIDSLLTSLVADSVTRQRHDSDRELIGQGIGNVVAGLIGGLPGAGATMRTVVNVKAGGRTALSGALHALVLLALLLGLAPLAELVPLPVLAGILLRVGWDIIDWGYIKRLARVPRDKAAVMLITLALTVLVDLITAVAVGIILASFVNARAFEGEQLKGVALHDGAEDEGSGALTAAENDRLREADGRVLVTRLSGAFSYASARELARRVGQRIVGHRVVIYDFTDVGYVDPSIAVAIDDLLDRALDDSQVVMVAGLAGRVKQTLEGFGVLDRILQENRFDDRAAGIDAALEQVRAMDAAETDPDAAPGPGSLAANATDARP